MGNVCFGNISLFHFSTRMASLGHRTGRNSSSWLTRQLDILEILSLLTHIKRHHNNLSDLIYFHKAGLVHAEPIQSKPNLHGWSHLSQNIIIMKIMK